MPANGLFVGLPKATIEAIRDKAVTFILEGKTIMSYGDGSTNASKQFAMPPQQMLQEANYALLRMEGGRTRGLYTNYNRLVDR
jgi:hypothetical protein